MNSRPRNTLEKILFGGIGSFLLVLLFPRGVKYFFRNMFAEIVSAAVTIILAGLLTQKLAEKITQDAETPDTKNTVDLETPDVKVAE